MVGPRKDRPVLLTVLHHIEWRRWGVVRPGERRARRWGIDVCVFKAPRTLGARTYTPVYKMYHHVNI